jgi:hypothetical protein
LDALKAARELHGTASEFRVHNVPGLDVRSSFLVILSGEPGHFAETIIREILRLPFFDRLQNEPGNKFRLVPIHVIG